jgi:hypothetical protein
MVAYAVACGSSGFAGHEHGSGGAHPPKAHHGTPKPAPPKPAAKPAPHPAPKHDPKPTPHEAHKTASAHSDHDRDHHHEHDHHNHDYHHDHHDHWDHGWVDGVVVGGSVTTDGSAGVVTGDGTAAPAAMAADVAGPAVSGRPQVQFSVDPRELDSYDAAARAAGMTRAEWIRNRLNAAAGLELK